MRRKLAPISVIKTTNGGTPSEVLLGKMMEQHVLGSDSVSFTDILSGLGMNDRNTKWRNAWRALAEKRMIDSCGDASDPVFTSGFRLTEEGKKLATTDEYKKAMAAVPPKPTTNEELHEQIKGKLMNQRGEQIFDLLVEHGAKSRKDLAKLMGISDTGAYFSYALQQLKDLDYAENISSSSSKAKLVRLTTKAFVALPEYLLDEK
eukprot:scaffold3314_cov162-Amphora_coffeaeformis.AAC.1